MMGQVTTPGFFGKVPARGDFLDRRVPPTIASSWEAWLQTLTVSVRESGERGWQDAWLTAPIWHFALGHELAPLAGGAGVLVASADRVGRLFPFTVIALADPAARCEPGAWAERAEALILTALADDFDPATFERALGDLGAPPVVQGRVAAAGAFALALDGDWPASGDPFADDDALSVGPGPNQSEWWTRGSDRLGPTRLRCNGLPAIAQGRAMILGGL